GETVTCTATYTITQADITAGGVTNHATAHAAGTNSNQDTVTVPATPEPHLTLVKQATLDQTKVAPANRTDAGDVINYTLTATNDGNVPLTAVTISDPTVGALTCHVNANPPTPQPPVLPPADILPCTGSHTLAQGDLNAGHVNNTATVPGKNPHNTTITGPDSANVPPGQQPHITLVKQATLDPTKVAPSNR